VGMEKSFLRRTTMIQKWLSARIKERTSIDGLVLIGAGVAFLIFKPIAAIIAYAAIIWGGYTFWKGEK